MAACIGVALASPAMSASIEGVTFDDRGETGGFYQDTVWELDGNVLSVQENPESPLDPYLEGNSTAPGSNVEIGDDAMADMFDVDNQSYVDWKDGLQAKGPRLLGTLDERDAKVYALMKGDWSANDYELAYAYTDAALASIGESSANWDPMATMLVIPAGTVLGSLPPLPTDFPVLCGQHSTAVTEVFVDGEITIEDVPISANPPVTADIDITIVAPAYRASDPNIAYVNLDGEELQVGLQGIYDLTGVSGYGTVATIFNCVDYTPDGNPVQASEAVLVKMDYDGETVYDEYGYSFSATRTNQGASDCQTQPGTFPQDSCSYSGNYQPEFEPVPPIGNENTYGSWRNALGRLRD
ncbi:MAG: hypothetical protein C1943_14430 [Halochromatium sp.]|nr:hypothetical protein [Halochromatium sp.]